MSAFRDRSSQSLPSTDPPSLAPVSKISTRPPRKAYSETPSFILMKEAFMSDSQIYTDSQHDPSIDRIALEDSLSIRQDEPGNETVGISRPERPFMVRLHSESATTTEQRTDGLIAKLPILVHHGLHQHCHVHLGDSSRVYIPLHILQCFFFSACAHSRTGRP